MSIDLIFKFIVGFGCYSDLLFETDISRIDLCNGNSERLSHTLVVNLCILVCLLMKVQRQIIKVRM